MSGCVICRRPDPWGGAQKQVSRSLQAERHLFLGRGVVTATPLLRAASKRAVLGRLDSLRVHPPRSDGLGGSSLPSDGLRFLPYGFIEDACRVGRRFGGARIHGYFKDGQDGPPRRAHLLFPNGPARGPREEPGRPPGPPHGATDEGTRRPGPTLTAERSSAADRAAAQRRGAARRRGSRPFAGDCRLHADAT